MVKHLRTITQEFEVESILNKREHPSGVQYLVKWRGYPEAESTWEPMKHLEGSADLVQEYELKCGRKLAVAKKRPAVGSTEDNTGKKIKVKEKNDDLDTQSTPKTPKVAMKFGELEEKPASGKKRSGLEGVAKKRASPKPHPLKRSSQLSVENWHLASEVTSPQGSFPTHTIGRVLRTYRVDGDLLFEVEWKEGVGNSVVTLQEMKQYDCETLVSYLAELA